MKFAPPMHCSTFFGLAIIAIISPPKVLAESPYETFVSSAGLTLSGDGALQADPDRDGIPNLLEFLFGGNPTVVNSHLLPTLTSTPSPGGQNLVFRYQRNTAASTAVTQVVEHTANLSLPWTAAIPGQAGVSLTVSDVDATSEEVTVTIPVAEGQRFVRLRVIEAPVLVDFADFVLIPEGSFEMGDPFEQQGVIGELPVHTVTLSAYYMAKTECTKEQWDDVRTWGLTNGYSDLYSGSGNGPSHPVHTLSWYDTVKWCNAASEKTGLNPVYRVEEAVYRTGESRPLIDYLANGYRLPTEAEWEKAARGGLSGKRFPWGDTISHSQANYISDESYDYDVSTTRGSHPTYVTGQFPHTSPVGSFAANGYGLFDMTGNIGERCGDWYSSTYYSSSPGTDPTGPVTGTGGVVRGGSSFSRAIACRVSYRHFFGDFSLRSFIGFRAARSQLP